MNKDYYKRSEMINEFAQRDCRTNDKLYNDGLKAIREYGYPACIGMIGVDYYCMCNNL